MGVKSDLNDTLRSMYRQRDGRATPPHVKRKAKGIVPRRPKKRRHKRHP